MIDKILKRTIQIGLSLVMIFMMYRHYDAFVVTLGEHHTTFAEEANYWMGAMSALGVLGVLTVIYMYRDHHNRIKPLHKKIMNKLENQ